MTSTYISIGFALLIQAGLAVWTAARLSEKVEGHGRWLTKINDTVEKHETRISTLEGALR